MGYRGEDVSAVPEAWGRQTPWQSSSDEQPAAEGGGSHYQQDGGYPGQGQPGQAGPGYGPQAGYGQGDTQYGSSYGQQQAYGSQDYGSAPAQPYGQQPLPGHYEPAPGYSQPGYPGQSGAYAAPGGGYQDPVSAYPASGGYPSLDNAAYPGAGGYPGGGYPNGDFQQPGSAYQEPGGAYQAPGSGYPGQGGYENPGAHGYPDQGANGYQQPGGPGYQDPGYPDAGASGYQDAGLNGYQGAPAYPGAYQGGGYEQPGGYAGQPGSGNYPALPGSGNYPALPGGAGYAEQGAYQNQGAFQGAPQGQGGYPARDAGNDWYGGQPAAANGASFADTGSYRLNGSVPDEYGTGPRGTLGDRDPVRGYAPGPGGPGSDQLATSVIPAVSAPPAAPFGGPQAAPFSGPQAAARSGPQQRAPLSGVQSSFSGPQPAQRGAFQDTQLDMFQDNQPGGQPGQYNGQTGQYYALPGQYDGQPGQYNGQPGRYGGQDDYATRAFGAPGPDDFGGAPSQPNGRAGTGYADDILSSGDPMAVSDPYQDRYGSDAPPRGAGGGRRGSGGRRGAAGGGVGLGPLRGRRLLIAVLAVIAVGIVAAAAYVFVLKPSSPASNPAATGPLPTASSNPSQQACEKTLGTYCHIETAADDPTPLTTAELYPVAFTPESDKISYSAVSTKTDTKCSSAVIGPDLIKALKAGKCTQVLRGSYVSGDNKIMGTIGVLNLGSTNEAHYAGKLVGQKDFIAPLTAAKGVASKLGKGTGVVEAEYKGHYLILTWSEFVNGADPKTTAQDKQLEQFGNDLVAGTANVTLSQRMVSGKSAAVSPTASASAKASASPSASK